MNHTIGFGAHLEELTLDFCTRKVKELQPIRLGLEKKLSLETCQKALLTIRVAQRGSGHTLCSNLKTNKASSTSTTTFTGSNLTTGGLVKVVRATLNVVSNAFQKNIISPS